MLDFFKKLFSPNTTSEEPQTEDETPLAVACLLVEAARVDQMYTDQERRFIESALASQFDLSPESAAKLREQADAKQDGATDIHQFTKVAKSLAADEKIRLVENMWRIILSDAEKDPHEDALMRRLCGLLYISDVESGAARRRVESQQGS